MGSISDYMASNNRDYSISNYRMRRYSTEEEMYAYYKSWVKKNGYPKLEQGCINCAELICINNCQGIMDSRVKKIKQ